MYYGYIYEIENLINGKKYIGQCASADVRRTQKVDNAYWGSGKILWQAYEKYGRENFARYIVEWCGTKEELDAAEKFYIKELKAIMGDRIYNIAEGGSNGDVRQYMTEEQKLAYHQKLKERYKDESVRRRMSEIRKGKKMPESFCIQNRERRKGSKKYNNGKIEIMVYVGQDVPDGFVPGGLKRPDTHTNHGRHWYHSPDNKEELMIFTEEAPDGWLRGRLPMTQEQKKLLSEHHNPNSVNHHIWTEEERKRLSEYKKANPSPAWNRGLTKETDGRIAKYANKIKGKRKK